MKTKKNFREVQIEDLAIGSGLARGKHFPCSATITIGSEAADTINVALQLLDGKGSEMATMCALPFYLSSQDDGSDIEGTGPDSISDGTDGFIIPSGDDSAVTGLLVSESDGDIDFDVNETSGDTFYLCLIFPDRHVQVSDEITFS